MPFKATALNEADAPLPCGNLQEQARLLRYRLLGNWARSLGIGHVATAHHRDDVAEGFLMRALRGSGVGGLARMASSAPMPMADDIVLLRPLLDWSHLELVAIVVAAGLIPVQDPSNADLRFDRARIRDLLAGSTLLDPAALARSAANLAEAEAAIDWMAAQAWRNRSQVEDGMVRLDPEGLPRELRRRLCRRAVETLAPGWDSEGLDGLLDALDSGAIATLAGVQATPGPEWRFRRAAPHRSAH